MVGRWWERATRARAWAPAALLLFVALVAPPSAATQWNDIMSLEVGDSLRLRLPGALRLDATMRGMRRDTLLLSVEGVTTIWPVASRDLETLERFGDRSPRDGFRHGAVLGLAAGVFIGAALGAAYAALRPDDTLERSSQLISSSLTGVGVGAAVGAIGGGFVGGAHPGRGWVTLSLPAR